MSKVLQDNWTTRTSNFKRETVNWQFESKNPAYLTHPTHPICVQYHQKFHTFPDTTTTSIRHPNSINPAPLGIPRHFLAYRHYVFKPIDHTTAVAISWSRTQRCVHAHCARARVRGSEAVGAKKVGTSQTGPLLCIRWWEHRIGQYR